VAQTIKVSEAFRVIQFSRVTNVDSLLVILVHVVNKGKIVIGKRMLSINLNAYFKVLNGHWVTFLLEVRQTQVVLHLGIVGFKFT